jgi:hypothetical protein
MILSYAITVCNELEEIKRLLPFLIENKAINDEVVILFDEKNGSPEVLEYLLTFNKLPNVQTWRGLDFENDFAEWKNKLSDYCKGDYIFQLDADELIGEMFMINIKSILETNPEVDLYYLSRINIVDGITDEHIRKWGWSVNQKGWINFPDKQGRIFKKKLKWFGKVHERIMGAETVTALPDDEDFCIIHHKQIERQEKQNNFYSTI